jgi:hypothetical protein
MMEMLKVGNYTMLKIVKGRDGLKFWAQQAIVKGPDGLKFYSRVKYLLKGKGSASF